jgi:hypothetical protein
MRRTEKHVSTALLVLNSSEEINRLLRDQALR